MYNSSKNDEKNSFLSQKTVSLLKNSFLKVIFNFFRLCFNGYNIICLVFKALSSLPVLILCKP